MADVAAKKEAVYQTEALIAEVVAYRPSPGQAKTVSVNTAPESRLPKEIPMMVRVGMSAFRNACRSSTRGVGSPFARAVRM